MVWLCWSMIKVEGNYATEFYYLSLLWRYDHLKVQLCCAFLCVQYTFFLLFLLCVQSSKSCREGSILTETPLKCLCIEIFDNFLLANTKNRWKPKRQVFPFVDICFCSRDMSFQSLGNLEKKWEKKLEHFVPLLTKIVTSQVGLLLVLYLNEMSFRRYWSESSKIWCTYQTRWE